jgi:GNAT superfamily N-acetyltransferase
MRLSHPETPAARTARNRLLQTTLRDARAPFAIAAEYPVVLGEDGARYSYCLEDGSALVAHANLWPRILKDVESGITLKVGLVGNVATDPGRRGEGLMRQLMAELAAAAKDAGLAALLLWSDLLEFYQKLGFQSYGAEDRYVFDVTSLPSSPGWRAVPEPTPARLGALLATRLAVPATLARSPEEFALLRTVPAVEMAVLGTGVETRGYALMGKGMDMLNVVHEWGAPRASDLLAGLRHLGETRDYAEVMLLAPTTLADEWRQELGRAAREVTRHAMALGLILDGPHAEAARQVLPRAFVWGLDSI